MGKYTRADVYLAQEMALFPYPLERGGRGCGGGAWPVKRGGEVYSSMVVYVRSNLAVKCDLIAQGKALGLEEGGGGEVYVPS